jgi:hypothetical protein
MSFWQFYINVIITILIIMHRPVCYLKHSVSKAGFLLGLQVEPTELGLIDRNRDELCLFGPTD